MQMGPGLVVKVWIILIIQVRVHSVVMMMMIMMILMMILTLMTLIGAAFHGSEFFL